MGVVRAVVGRGRIVRQVGKLVFTVGEGRFLFIVVGSDGLTGSHMVCEGGRPCDRWLVPLSTLIYQNEADIVVSSVISVIYAAMHRPNHLDINIQKNLKISQFQSRIQVRPRQRIQIQ
jgi:hypothetical protein